MKLSTWVLHALAFGTLASASVGPILADGLTQIKAALAPASADMMRKRSTPIEEVSPLDLGPPALPLPESEDSPRPVRPGPRPNSVPVPKQARPGPVRPNMGPDAIGGGQPGAAGTGEAAADGTVGADAIEGGAAGAAGADAAGGTLGADAVAGGAAGAAGADAAAGGTLGANAIGGGAAGAAGADAAAGVGAAYPVDFMSGGLAANAIGGGTAGAAEVGAGRYAYQGVELIEAALDVGFIEGMNAIAETVRYVKGMSRMRSFMKVTGLHPEYIQGVFDGTIPEETLGYWMLVAAEEDTGVTGILGVIQRLHNMGIVKVINTPWGNALLNRWVAKLPITKNMLRFPPGFVQEAPMAGAEMSGALNGVGEVAGTAGMAELGTSEAITGVGEVAGTAGMAELGTSEAITGVGEAGIFDVAAEAAQVAGAAEVGLAGAAGVGEVAEVAVAAGTADAAVAVAISGVPMTVFCVLIVGTFVGVIVGALAIGGVFSRRDLEDNKAHHTTGETVFDGGVRGIKKHSPRAASLQVDWEGPLTSEELEALANPDSEASLLRSHMTGEKLFESKDQETLHFVKPRPEDEKWVGKSALVSYDHADRSLDVDGKNMGGMTFTGTLLPDHLKHHAPIAAVHDGKNLQFMIPLDPATGDARKQKREARGKFEAWNHDFNSTIGRFAHRITSEAPGALHRLGAEAFINHVFEAFKQEGHIPASIGSKLAAY